MTDAQTLNMILGGTTSKKSRKPRKKQARVGALVKLFSDGCTYTIEARDDRYKNAFFLNGIECSVSRDMFEVV